MIVFIPDKLNKMEEKKRKKEKKKQKQPNRKKEEIAFYSWRVVFLGFDFS